MTAPEKCGRNAAETMQPLVRLAGVTKRYRSLTAVDNLDLEIYPGEIFGFLGPNGSGKTTIFLMLMGLTQPTGGEVEVGGVSPLRDPITVKRQVSYLPDTLGFYEDMTAAENMRYTGELAGLPPGVAEERIPRLLEQVGLLEQRDKKVGEFSRGMKQRLGIADVLLKEPRIAILDEPTLGLDPEGARELLGMIGELSRERGITVLISSHQLEHIQQICGRVAIFKKGVMKACGSLDELAEQMQRDVPNVAVVSVEADPRFPGYVGALEHVVRVEETGAGYEVEYENGHWNEVFLSIVQNGFAVRQLVQKRGSLQQIYQHYFEAGEEGGSSL